MSSTQTTPLLISELDFDLILTNLQNYMQGQTTFNSYNFKGAGLSVLLRELAYNTNYGAFFLNMLANELAISTSQVHDNLVNLAKSLNYVPASMEAPTAFVNVIVTPPGGNSATSLTIPAFSSFQSQAINGQNFTYITTQSYSTVINNGQFVFANVAIQEGIVTTYAFTASTDNPRDVFNIPSSNIDTKTLTVLVTENTPSPAQTFIYNFETDPSLLTGNSRVYFLEGAQNYTYNLYFGDGVFGKSLTPGDIVQATYISTNGPASNYANGFTSMSPIGGFSNVVIQPINSSNGGNLAEPNASIRQNAPLAYTTQERAVTIDDYNFLLNRDYGNIGSMAMWGGDKNIPPIYGTLFLSIRPKIGQVLSNIQKQQISNLLSTSNMPTIIPNIVDPDYSYILVQATVNYNPSKLTTSTNQLVTNITNAILNYGSTQLGQFNQAYLQSGITNAIDSSDPSIIGSDVESFLSKRFFPTLGQSQTYTFNYNTPLHRGGLLEKLYSSPGAILNDTFGNPQTCFIEENINTYQGISFLNIVNPGFNYTGQPDLIISGDGVGATGHVVIVNGQIQGAVLDTAGEGYNFASANVVGGGGYNGSVTPILTAQYGILDTYYYTATNKVILNSNQGTVDHINGIVTLNNFNPIGINNLNGQLTINVKPDNDIVVPTRNNILLIDPTDPTAISITLIPTIL